VDLHKIYENISKDLGEILDDEEDARTRASRGGQCSRQTSEKKMRKLKDFSRDSMLDMF
jgi:hypothetical protein